MKNKERAWQNFGDVNFLEYGGCLIRKDIREDAYEVISLKIPASSQDVILRTSTTGFPRRLILSPDMKKTIDRKQKIKK